jgi:hypothetical protein
MYTQCSRCRRMAYCGGRRRDAMKCIECFTGVCQDRVAA